MLRAFGVTDKGRVRATNEDCFGIDEGLRLCVVADGMGGHNAGEVASRLAVAAVVEHVREAILAPKPSVEDTGAWPFGYELKLSRTGNLLKTAVHIANLQIIETAVTSEQYSGMGTTIVAALMAGPTLSVAHVGDSRLYLFTDDTLKLLTSDDSWVAAMMAQDPEVDPIALQHHPMRNALTSAVGARAIAEVHLVEEQLKGGEFIAITTDGIHGVLEHSRMHKFLAEGWDSAAIATNLVREALSRGSRDNCTAVVAQYIPE